MSELNKLLKQFIGSNQVDGSKILLENGESLRAKKADGTEKSVLKVNSSDKIEFVEDIYVGLEKLSTESGVDAKILVEKQRAESSEQSLDQKISTEKSRAEGVESQLSSSITSGVAEAKSHAETKASEAEVNAKAYADTQDAAKLVEAKSYSDSKLVEAKSYTDGKIADVIGGIAPATLDTIKEIADALQSEQTATGSILSQLSSLSSDVADVEVAIQDVSDDLAAETLARQSADSALNVRVIALEAKPAGDSYSPYTVLMTESNLAYIDLDRQAKAIMSAAIGHLVAREGKDFSQSVVGGVTRITFINGFAQNGGTPVQPNQEFHCVYAYQA